MTIISCSANPQQNNSNLNYSNSKPPEQPISQQTSSTADDLDNAIRKASDYLDQIIPKGNKIVILNIQSSSAPLTEYIIDELIANAVNDKNLSVVDRQKLDEIRKEQQFQVSGEVDDKLAVEIGQFVGAQTIISGKISPIGDIYRLSIRALNVKTAEVQGQYNQNIASGKLINELARTGVGSANLVGCETTI
jgi:hypothetical protein